MSVELISTALLRLVEVGWIESYRESDAEYEEFNGKISQASAEECLRARENGMEWNGMEKKTPLPPLATLAVEKAVPSKDWIQEQHSLWYDQAFWNHKNRAASLKAFDKQIRALVKTMSCQEAAEFLYNKALDDRARFEPTSDWEWRRNLHPATWLNGARWEDQPASGGTNGKPSAVDRTHALAKSRFERFGHI